MYRILMTFLFGLWLTCWQLFSESSDVSNLNDLVVGHWPILSAALLRKWGFFSEV